MINNAVFWSKSQNSDFRPRMQCVVSNDIVDPQVFLQRLRPVIDLGYVSVDQLADEIRLTPKKAGPKAIYTFAFTAIYLAHFADNDILNCNPIELSDQISRLTEDNDFIKFQCEFLIETNIYYLTDYTIT